jgi:hypothetical protein
MVMLRVGIRSVRGWWLPRSGITKLEQLCMGRACKQKSSGVEIGGVCLFVLGYYYWGVVYIDGVGVLARGRSDVLGKWRSGVRQMQARRWKGRCRHAGTDRGGSFKEQALPSGE